MHPLVNNFFSFNLEGTVHIIEDINVNIPELAKRLLLICGLWQVRQKQWIRNLPTLLDNVQQFISHCLRWILNVLKVAHCLTFWNDSKSTFTYQ